MDLFLLYNYQDEEDNLYVENILTSTAEDQDHWSLASDIFSFHRRRELMMHHSNFFTSIFIFVANNDLHLCCKQQKKEQKKDAKEQPNIGSQ